MSSRDFLKLRRSGRWLASQGRSAAWLVMAVGVALSLAAALGARSLAEREARFKFRSVVAARAASAQAHMQSYADLLYGVQGLFQADPEPSRAAFERYVYSLNLPLNFPGVRSIAYAKRVPPDELEAFDAGLRRDPELHRRGIGEVLVRPPGRRAEHLVVTYVEPLHLNKGALGFDIASDDGRMAVVARARDSGMPTLTDKLVLAGDATASEPAVVMRLALFGGNAFTPDVERRREHFTGVVNVTFLLEEFAQHLLAGESYGRIALTLHDGGYAGADSRPAPREIYSLPAALPGRPDEVFAETLDIVVGQRLWTLGFKAPRDFFMSGTDRWLPAMAFGAVLVASLLLGGLIHSLASARVRAKSLALAMTADLQESQAKLAEEKRRTQELIEVLPNPVYFKRVDGRYLGVNRAWETYFGLTREAFLGKTVHELYPNNPDIAQRLHADDQQLWDNPGTKVHEARIVTLDGKMRDAIYYKATFTGADGRVAGLIGSIVDITERKQAQLRLALEHVVVRMLSEDERPSGSMAPLLKVIAESLGCACGAYWLLDRKTQEMACVETWSEASPDVQVFAQGSLQARYAQDRPGGLVMRAWRTGEPVWISDLSRIERLTRPERAVAAGLRLAIAFPVRFGSETIGVMDFFGRDSRLPDEALLQSTRAIGSQIGLFMARWQSEERIRRMAHYDELTGLANRSMFHQNLRHALDNARREKRALLVLFIDLDRFKNINDTLGHESGDLVLKEVAQRLVRSLRKSDTVARLGGDEFVVLIEEMQQATSGAVVAQNLLDAIARPFRIGAQDYHVTASIGISVFPADCEDVLGLLRNADIAMYRAKDHGKNNYTFYSPDMNVRTVERLALESDLRRALEHDEFVLNYQPKIDIASGRITGAEALIRWSHPTRGLVAPMQFIPLAEEIGLIGPIGRWVLKTACEQSRAWRSEGLAVPRIAVNLSARQFAHDDLIQDVAKVLSASGVGPDGLELEITESMMMADPARTVRLLTGLSGMGIRIAIDDFGTGHSSLSYLKRFPIDSVKIDRSFIRDLPGDSDDAAITRAIITMAHGLEMSVVAEGVETDEQFAFLRAHGCNELQGFHFSKPLPAAEFARLVRDHAEAGTPGTACARGEAKPARVVNITRKGG